MIKIIKKELIELADEKYQKFSSSLLPGVNNVLGVRLPILRSIAKKILKEDYKTFLAQNDDEFMELTLIEAMVLGGIELDYKLIKKFITKINNWSICDCFCSSLKKVKNNKTEFKRFLEPYLRSDKEFELRFAFVILLNYYIDDDFNYVIDKIIKFKNDAYYAKMAAAWCLSYCFMKKFDETLEILKSKDIQDFTLRKGIQKARESFKLSPKEKNILRQFLVEKIL